VHRLAGALLGKLHEEAAGLPSDLGWDAFAVAWWRTVRRVVLGDGARDDEEVTDLLRRLRARANWSFAAPDRPRLRARFQERLDAHLARAEPGSLAALVASVPASPGTHPGEQVPQWLFAFDAAGIATFRALALLATHPDQRARAEAEATAGDLRAPRELPFLRACLLESVRLWPTTPAILRDTTVPTSWDGATLAAGAGVVIFTPFFHRDGSRLAHADRFAPESWLDGEGGAGTDAAAVVPFSAGPATCPGRELVLLLGSTLLARLISTGAPQRAAGARLSPAAPLPATLSPYRLRFRVPPRPN
jgi:cytochrome P450